MWPLIHSFISHRSYMSTNYWRKTDSDNAVVPSASSLQLELRELDHQLERIRLRCEDLVKFSTLTTSVRTTTATCSDTISTTSSTDGSTTSAVWTLPNDVRFHLSSTVTLLLYINLSKTFTCLILHIASLPAPPESLKLQHYGCQHMGLIKF